MIPQQLSPAAQVIRNEIKEMIDGQGNILEEDVDENGNKRYRGTLLDKKISLLKTELKIDKSWTGRLVYWSKPTKLLNDQKPGYLIPLSENVKLTPGGQLPGGSYICVDDEPILSSGAAAIFIVPSDNS